MVAEPVVVITTGLVADDVVDDVVVLSDVFKASTADPSENTESLQQFPLSKAKLAFAQQKLLSRSALQDQM